MTDLHDEDERLTTLLRAIPIPEPPPDFLAATRRRYLEAVEARYRRDVFTGLAAAGLAFMLVALLLSAVKSAGLIGWGVTTIASWARWMDVIGIVLSHVPPLVWTPVMLVSVLSLLSIASLLRLRSPAVVK
jgi:hypothetical protein